MRPMPTHPTTPLHLQGVGGFTASPDSVDGRLDLTDQDVVGRGRGLDTHHDATAVVRRSEV